MGGWLESLAATPGELALLGLLVASLLEAGLFPTGADFVLIFVVAARPDDWASATACAIVGSVAGAALGYGVGRGVARPLIRRVLPERVASWIEGVYRRNDVAAVATAGLLPFVPFKHVSLTAGFFELDHRRFMVSSTLSRTVRFLGLGIATYFFRDEVRTALVAHGWLILLAILCLGSIVTAVVRRAS